jgi:type VI secretion system ImpA/VasJ family protein
MAEVADVAATFAPRLFPAEAILAPFKGQNPAGEDLALSGIYEQLKEASRADDPAVLGGDTFKPKGGWKTADWGQVSEIATRCLKDRSKDFRAAGYLARALAERNGLTGMREGAWLLVEIQNRFWDHLHPLPDRIKNPDKSKQGKVLDPVPRAQDLEVVLAHYARLLEGYPPCPDSEDDEKIDKVLLRAENLGAEMDRLDALIDERYLNRGPSLSVVREPLERHARSYREMRQAREDARRNAAEEAERLKREGELQAAQEAARLAGEQAAREQSLKQLGLDPAAVSADLGRDPRSREDVLGRIAHLAGWLRKNDATDPAAYRLPVVASWSAPDAGAPEGAPPEAARVELKRMADGRAWDDLVTACRASLAQPWGRHWLDLISYLALAVEELGKPGLPALEDLKAEVRHRLSRSPELRRATFSDGTPVASEETQAWLDSVLAEKPQGDGATGVQSGFPPELVSQAEGLEDAEALVLLQSAVGTATSERERFLMRLDLAEFCARRGLGVVAEALFSDLAGAVDRAGLDRWESPQLLARVFEGLYRQAQQGEGGAEDRQRLARQAFEKLCLLDPGRALRNR